MEHSLTKYMQQKLTGEADMLGNTLSIINITSRWKISKDTLDLDNTASTDLIYLKTYFPCKKKKITFFSSVQWAPTETVIMNSIRTEIIQNTFIDNGIKL